jgi:CO/xanthine dehydrogenase Mo-binding subunit
MDIIAEKLGIDPVALRKKNIIKEGEENLRGEITHSIGAEECLEKAAEWIGWGHPPEAPSSGHVRRGKGLALANKYTIIDTVSSAAVKIHKDGTIEVRCGIEEVGQGGHTVLSQIAAEEFGVPMGKIKMVWGDTDNVPWDFGAVSSRSTLMLGNAVRGACRDARKHMFEMAAPVLGANPQDLETRAGMISLKGTPKKAIRIADLFLPGAVGSQKSTQNLSEEAELTGKAIFWFKDVSEDDPESGQGKRQTATYCYTAQAVEVEVDTETGAVKVLRFCSATDMGTPINPKLCEAQMEGGMGMGIGNGLYEEMVLDKGELLNPSFKDYRIPSMMEIPSGDNVKSILVTSAPHRDGPFGAKGSGEAAMTPTAAALANAVYNAVGVRIVDLPITAEKVLAALKKKK